MIVSNLTLFENSNTMHNLDGDETRTEQQSKLYVRYNKPQTLEGQKKALGSKLNNELYLKVLAPSQRNLASDSHDGVLDKVSTFGANLNDETWEIMYLQFKNFVIRNGHTYISSDSEHEKIKDWINRQILNRPYLLEYQFLKLDILGVNWNIVLSRDHTWKLMLKRLEDFKKEFGHCRVPHSWEKDKQLALWVMRQRKMNLQVKILDYRRQLLNQIGFTWAIQETYNKQWENYFCQLADFKKKFGHCNVPGKNIKLVSWIERQRLSKKKNLLASQRQQRLNEIEFVWGFDKIKKKDWDERYRQLANFSKMHGHSFVPVNYYENKLLGNWVALQRKLEAQGKLSKSRLDDLDKLNFVWSAQTAFRLKLEYDLLWDRNFEKLIEYKRLNGTCQVSVKSQPLLQAWSTWQRKLFYENRMAPDRGARLDSISFPWSINEGYWKKMFELLSSFYDQFGHTRVPSHWSENPRLSAWVYRTRSEKHKLGDAKIASLNRMKFEWTIQHKIVVGWPAMYNRLLAFKISFGHTRVPVKWFEDPKLGKWVGRMRNEKKKMSKERLALLQAAEFHW